VLDAYKTLSQEDTVGNEAIRSLDSISHKRSETTSIPPHQLSSRWYGKPRSIPQLDPGTPDEEMVRALYELLRKQSGLGKMQEVEGIVEQLVCRYGEAPNVRLYAALILVNHNSEFGSAAEVERILREMRSEKMEPDETCYHNALKVSLAHWQGLYTQLTSIRS